MRKIEDIQELRSIQMGILDEVHRFCEAHGLRYFLSSGTLIGAVRHKGYIPWDDDIDIYMPREDYEKFLASYRDDKGVYRAINPKMEAHYYYTFAKVVDLRTKMVETETEGYEIGVYMDIFPVDYVTDNLSRRERVFRLKKLLYKIRRCKISNTNPLQSYLAYWCYKSLPVSAHYVFRLIQRLIVLEKPTCTVCNMTEAGPKMKGCFPAEDIASSVEIEFEGKQYKTMVGYKDYLERTYGDYMTLPPVEQRVTHHFEAYWL
ncbi:MAG: LicD family protein [Prevotella sp.]|nr:LicD family protein [Prevotella sp.]